MHAVFRAAARTAALCICLGTPAMAQDATLTSRGGGLSVAGRLISYDGLIYRIDTQWGRLSVDAAAVDCTGPGCPDLTRFAPELRIAVEPWLADRVLMPLIRSFARSEGMSLEERGPLLELAHGPKPELRVRLRPLSGPATPVLAADDADAALAVAEQAGRLVAHLPMVPATSPHAPTGPLNMQALRRQRAEGGDWAMLTTEPRPLVWHSLPAQGSIDRATTQTLGPLRATSERARDPEALAAALRRDPWGIALLPLPLPPGLMARDIVLGCGLMADLSPFAAGAGDHPLLLPVSWIETGRRLPPVARALADHLASPAGQAALITAGLPAPSPMLRQSLDAAGIRLYNTLADPNPALALADRQAALAALTHGTRLAPTFRFDRRNGALDAAARSALSDLSAYLATARLAGQEVVLVGFSDNAGSAAHSRSAALARADAVRDALLAATPDLPDTVVLRSESLGAAMPIACNDTADGRHANRRVEVWLRPVR